MNVQNDSRVLNDVFPLTITKTPMTREKHPPDFHHWHNFFEISYVLKGSSICHTGENYFKVSADDIVIFNNSEIHGWNIQEDILLLVLNFSGEIVCADTDHPSFVDADYLKVFAHEGTNYQNIIPKYNQHTEEIYTLMQNIYDEYTHDYECKYLMIKAEVLKILTILTRYFKLEKSDQFLLSQRRKDLQEIGEILNFINENFTEKISLEQAAKMAHMNPCYFSSIFHRITGVPFKSYIIEMRIHEAHRQIGRAHV